MIKKRRMEFRVTQPEFEKIYAIAKAKGFTALSDYLRYVAIDQDFVMQQRIQEIHEKLLGEQKPKRYKRNEVRKPFL